MLQSSGISGDWHNETGKVQSRIDIGDRQASALAKEADRRRMGVGVLGGAAAAVGRAPMSEPMALAKAGLFCLSLLPSIVCR